MTADSSLHGRTVALAEGRQLEELAQLLESEGAVTLRCPLIGIEDAPDPGPVLAWLRALLAEPFAYVVLLTGEGLRRLLNLAEREGIRDDVIAALRQVRIVTRGPKPVQVLRELGLTPALQSTVPTTAGVIAALQKEALAGKTVGVQLYSESNEPLEEFLRNAGATVRTVQPYIYAAAADTERVAALIQQLERGAVAVLIFTSSPQVDRLLEVATERGLEAALRQGLARTRVAAVGPVIGQHLQEQGIRVDIQPAQGFVMKNLVQQIKRQLTPDAG